MPKHQKQSNRSIKAHVARARTSRLIISGVLSLSLLMGGVPLLVHAVSCSSSSDCQSQINNLNGQNATSQATLNSLELQAQGYQGAIDTLQAQINTIQAQIAANQAQQANIQNKITANEQKIAQEKSDLANDIKTSYINGQITPEEMLATSDNLSQFIDKQEAYSKIQDTINSTLQQIAVLQKQLSSQKDQIDKLLSDESAQNAQVASAQAQQSSLLSYNQTQQNAYNAQVSANKSAISALQRQQAAIIQAGTRNVTIPSSNGGSGGACDSGYGNGNYPYAWCNAYQDSVTTAGYFPNRECTSYAFWYFTQVEGHSDFYTTGNANQWLRYSNYPVHSSPAVGALAVETTGTYGHVAVVQALPGQTYAGATVPAGYVLVSEMNYDYAGHFRYSYSPLTKFGGYIY